MSVSICIPTYNQCQYLEQAIRSALNQTQLPDEIIVSNDCSTDNTMTLLEHLAKEIQILKILHQPVNLGIAKNTDLCLRSARGEFVVRLDSDDYLSPLFCEKLTFLLNEYKESGYAHGNVQEIDQHNNFLLQRRLARRSVFQPAADALRNAIKGYKVAANIIMFRREALEKVNYTTNRPDYVEDFHLSASLASNGFGNVFSSDILSYYRIWTDAGKVRQRRKLMEIVGLRKVFEEVLLPAFKERNWDIENIDKVRTTFACKQADCLGWAVYSENEKNELEKELKKLSSSKIAQSVFWLNRHNLGSIPNFFYKFSSIVKTVVKKIIFQLW
jgi:glycosyltransferase involved in cell wall biosynthesis